MSKPREIFVPGFIEDIDLIQSLFLNEETVETNKHEKETSQTIPNEINLEDEQFDSRQPKPIEIYLEDEQLDAPGPHQLAARNKEFEKTAKPTDFQKDAHPMLMQLQLKFINMPINTLSDLQKQQFLNNQKKRHASNRWQKFRKEHDPKCPDQTSGAKKAKPSRDDAETPTTNHKSR